MPKFKNPHGVVIETKDASTVNDYRHREGFTEVVAKPKPADKPTENK